MAYEHLCMYCFEDLQGQAVCPHCGRDSRAAVPQIQMLPGTQVYHQRFLVGRALGQDATGIVYSAYDTKRENKLRLREYLPRDCAERLNDGSVVPMAGLEDQFERGMKKLRASVEGVEDPKKRHFYFEENGTAYIAQRKSAAAAAAAGRDDEDYEGGSGMKQIGLIVGIAAAVVVIAAVVIVSLVNGALRSSDDLVQNPTLSPSSSASLWAPEVTASPTPYVSPTFAALVDPDQSWMDYTYTGDVNKDFQHQLNQSATKKPTPKPTLNPSGDDYDTVNGKSDREEIEDLQERLVELGWLRADGVTGKYDSDTKQAVKDFQNYVNSSFQPAEKLSVDGIAGPKTLQWLYATNAVRPTPTPTPLVTPDPSREDVIDKDSAKGDIKMVQQKLIVLGLMEKGTDDGVYGTTTTAAVKKFQQRVNQLQGYDALPVSGTVDPDTLAYLDYYVDWWLKQQQATATPEPVLPTFTPAPTDAPTPVPTDAPEKDEGGVTVNPDSDKESIAFVQEMLIGVGLLKEGSDDGVYGKGTTNAVIAFQEWVNRVQGEGTLSVTGFVDPETLSYLEYAYSNGMTYQPEGEPTTEPTVEPTTEPTTEPDGSVTPESGKEAVAGMQSMLIKVGLLKEGGDDGDYGKGTKAAVEQFQQWVNDQLGQEVLTVSGVADAQTMKYLEHAVNNGMTYPTPEPEATDAPTPEPTEEPAAVPVKLELSVGGAEWNDGAYAVTGDAVTFQWTADGAVDSYYVYVYDQDGGLFYEQEATDRTGGQFGADSLTPGMIYTIQIGALPANGDGEDMSWAEASFYVPGAAQPDPTDAPTPEPTAEPDGSVTPESDREAVANMQGMLISVGLLKEGGDDGAYGNGTKNAVALFQQWVNSQLGEEVLEVSGIADAQTMKYLEHAVNNGMTYPTPEPTAEPTPVPTDAPEKDEGGVSVTPESEKESIAFVQRMLISVGLLKEGGDDGDYGKGTKTAVEQFQQWVNSVQGEGTLSVTGLCDADTLNYLEYAYSNGMTYPAPEATDAPAPEVTAEPDPTDAPEEPEATDAPAVQPVKLSLSIGGAEKLDNGVHSVTGDTVSFEWAADGAVESYYVYVYDQNGGLFYENEATDRTGGQFSADALTPGMVYTIQIGALPAGGDSDDMSWTEAYFGVKKPAATEAPTPEPTDEPEPEPTEKPEGAKVEIAGAEYNDMEEATIAAGLIDLSWTCDVDAEKYALVIYHIDDVEQENPLLKHQTEDSFVTFDLTEFAPGTYRLLVGARIAGTDEVVWSASTIHIIGE